MLPNLNNTEQNQKNLNIQIFDEDSQVVVQDRPLTVAVENRTIPNISIENEIFDFERFFSILQDISAKQNNIDVPVKNNQIENFTSTSTDFLTITSNFQNSFESLNTSFERLVEQRMIDVQSINNNQTSLNSTFKDFVSTILKDTSTNVKEIQKVDSASVMNKEIQSNEIQKVDSASVMNKEISSNEIQRVDSTSVMNKEISSKEIQSNEIQRVDSENIFQNLQKNVENFSSVIENIQFQPFEKKKTETAAIELEKQRKDIVRTERTNFLLEEILDALEGKFDILPEKSGEGFLSNLFGKGGFLGKMLTNPLTYFGIGSLFVAIKNFFKRIKDKFIKRFSSIEIPGLKTVKDFFSTLKNIFVDPIKNIKIPKLIGISSMFDGIKTFFSSIPDLLKLPSLDDIKSSFSVIGKSLDNIAGFVGGLAAIPLLKKFFKKDVGEIKPVSPKPPKEIISPPPTEVKPQTSKIPKKNSLTVVDDIPVRGMFGAVGDFVKSLSKFSLVVDVIFGAIGGYEGYQERGKILEKPEDKLTGGETSQAVGAGVIGGVLPFNGLLYNWTNEDIFNYMFRTKGRDDVEVQTGGHAKGFVADKPSWILTGEYAGVKENPEVTIQMDRLQEKMLNTVYEIQSLNNLTDKKFKSEVQREQSKSNAINISKLDEVHKTNKRDVELLKSVERTKFQNTITNMKRIEDQVKIRDTMSQQATVVQMPVSNSVVDNRTTHNNHQSFIIERSSKNPNNYFLMQ